MKGYVLRYYNMCSENVRVPESQHLFLDLLERPYPVHRGLIAPQEIRTEFIQKKKFNFKSKHKKKGGAKSKN